MYFKLSTAKKKKKRQIASKKTQFDDRYQTIKKNKRKIKEKQNNVDKNISSREKSESINEAEPLFKMKAKQLLT